jgi:hypothetical protein
MLAVRTVLLTTLPSPNLDAGLVAGGDSVSLQSDTLVFFGHMDMLSGVCSVFQVCVCGCVCVRHRLFGFCGLLDMFTEREGRPPIVPGSLYGIVVGE